MKKYSLFIAVLLIVALLSMTTRAVTAAESIRLGDRLSLFGENTTFPAGQPFYIAHGWWNPTNIPGVGLFKFSLDVDGTPVREDFIERSTFSGSPDELLWFWVYNFPDGMTGTHTLTGHWTGPCQGLVDMGVIQVTCEKTNEIIESASQTIIIDFVP